MQQSSPAGFSAAGRTGPAPRWLLGVFPCPGAHTPQHHNSARVATISGCATLCLQGDWHMPKLRQHLAQGGINFTNCEQQGHALGIPVPLLFNQAPSCGGVSYCGATSSGRLPLMAVSCAARCASCSNPPCWQLLTARCLPCCVTLQTLPTLPSAGELRGTCCVKQSEPTAHVPRLHAGLPGSGCLGRMHRESQQLRRRLV